jgi:hypothetical protein
MLNRNNTASVSAVDASGLLARVTSASSSIGVGVWVHVAVVEYKGTLTMYVNGTLAQSTAATSTLWFNTRPVASLTLGHNGLSLERLTGNMQDLRVYTAAKYTSNFSAAFTPMLKVLLSSITRVGQTLQVPITATSYRRARLFVSAKIASGVAVEMSTTTMPVAYVYPTTVSSISISSAYRTAPTSSVVFRVSPYDALNASPAVAMYVTDVSGVVSATSPLLIGQGTLDTSGNVRVSSCVFPMAGNAFTVYARITSPEGVVQLCNTRDENLTNTQAETILSQVLVGGTAGCADISRFCYRSEYIPPDGSPIQRAYHCRIRQLIVNDDTQTQGSSGGSEAMRRQNNTFTIDTTGDPIYLYFNNAWQEPTNQCSGRVNVSGVLIDKCTLKGTGVNMTITPYKYSSENKLTQLARNADWTIDDGQIQHVRCEYSSAVAAGGTSPSGLTTITPDQACPTPVFSTDVTRVRLFSDVNGFKLSLGDDGFVRDVFLYLVRGDLTLANESNAETSFGLPNFRGVAWVNNLSMGSQCPKCAGGAFIAVPAATNYRRNDLFASDSQMETLLDYYRDVVARGITRTGLR